MLTERTNPFTISLKVWLIIVLLGVLAPGVGLALPFKIINLTENHNQRFASRSFNSFGVVGASVDPDDFVLIDKTGNITNLTQSQFSTVHSGSINDNGEAAILADGDVYFFDGTNLNNITNGSLAVNSLQGHTLNNSGHIVFSTGSQLFLYDGSAINPIPTGNNFISIGTPQLNNQGQIAFLGITASPHRADMFIFSGNTILHLSNDPSLKITDVNGSPSINESGQVLFLANTTTSANNLFLFDGSTTVNLTTTLGLPAPQPFGASAVALNNNDQIAFITTPSPGFNDLWFLENGQVFKITSQGQGMGGLYINDNTEIVFSASDTGETDVFLAIPGEAVVIDINPKQFPNRVNPMSRNIKVAIMSTDSFDATTVDTASIRFGASGLEASSKKSRLRDLNRDGLPDLLAWFDTRLTGLQCGDTQARLTGSTIVGQLFDGIDSIVTIGCRKR